MVPVLVPDELLSCRRGWQVGAGGGRVGQNVFPGFLLETLPVYGFLDGIKTATFPFKKLWLDFSHPTAPLPPELSHKTLRPCPTIAVP